MNRIPVGIDKLVLTSKDFSCPTIPKMTPVSSVELGEEHTPLLTCEDGIIIATGRLYKNTRKLNYCSNVGINSNGLQVTFNPNKHYHDYHTYSDPKKLKDSFSIIEDELKEIGIKTNVRDMVTYRIDINADAQMSKPYKDFKPLMDALNGKRMKATPYTTGIEIGNKSVSNVFYDKGQDVWNRTKESIKENNLTRNEVRLHGTKVVKAHSSTLFSTANNIIRHYDFIEEFYTNKTKEILKSISCYQDHQSNQLELEFDRDRYALQTIMDTQKKNKLQYYLSVFGGMEFIIDKYGSVSSFEKNVIDYLAIHRQTKKNLKQQIRDIYNSSVFLNKGYEKRRKEIGFMAEEMHDKFVLKKAS